MFDMGHCSGFSAQKLACAVRHTGFHYTFARPILLEDLGLNTLMDVINKEESKFSHKILQVW